MALERPQFLTLKNKPDPTMKLYRSLIARLLPVTTGRRLEKGIFFLSFFIFFHDSAVAQSSPSQPANPGGYVLPVDITIFNLKLEEAGIGLDWSTESETHINYFVLEKSNDNQHFYDVVTVFAKGSDKGGSYHYDDVMKAFPTGAVYYRIRIIANGGNIRHSEVRVIRPLQSSREGQLLAFPNPCTRDLAIAIPENWQKISTVIEVYHPTGLLLLQMKIDRPSAVEHIDLSSLGKGIFIIKAVSRQGTLYQKIQKN
jgi:hypothetical protein